MKGLFITIEGADGSGKSTQLELLKSYFRKNGKEIIVTREPGGTVISEAIREIILDQRYMEMSDRTEVLLYAASRAQHVEQFIRPALEEGKIVICDRFVDSSLVYQGIARGLGLEQVGNINEWATGGLTPDITILLDLDQEIGLMRKSKQKTLDRLELQKTSFHKKVVEGYRLLAEKYPERIIMINASKPVQEIHEKIITSIDQVIRGGSL